MTGAVSVVGEDLTCGFQDPPNSAAGYRDVLAFEVSTDGVRTGIVPGRGEFEP